MYRLSFFCLLLVFGHIQYAQDAYNMDQTALVYYRAYDQQHRDNIKAYGLMSDKYVDEDGRIYDCFLGKGNIMMFECIPSHEADENTFGYRVNVAGTRVYNSLLRHLGNWQGYYNTAMPLSSHMNRIRALEHCNAHSGVNNSEVIVLRDMILPSALVWPEEVNR